MTKIFPLSPWNFSTFLQCPFKFWCQKDYGIPPLPQKENVYNVFGRNLHKLIQSYYMKIIEGKKQITVQDIHSILELVVNEEAPRLGISLNKGYLTHLGNFEEFEVQRVKNKWEIIDVEKKISNGRLKGIIDAIFRDRDGEVIVVDWKTGKWNKDFLIQGYVYKLLSKADKVLFFQSLNGFEHMLREKELEEGKRMIVNILNQVKRGISNKKRNRFCGDCEYSLHCRFDDLGLKIEEL